MEKEIVKEGVEERWITNTRTSGEYRISIVK